jgi:hypothetical protein
VSRLIEVCENVCAAKKILIFNANNNFITGTKKGIALKANLEGAGAAKLRAKLV